VEVPVQTDGTYRVPHLHVTPGQRVTRGRPLVQLDDTRAALDLGAAGTRLDRRRAAVRAAEADAKKAEVAVTNAKAQVELAKAEGAADSTAAAAEAARAASLVGAAEFTLTVEEDLFRTKGVANDVKVRQARVALGVAKADRDAAVATNAKAKTAADVKVRQSELAVSTAAADLASLTARAEEARQEAADAEVEVRRAKLEHDRTRIAAPIDGVVMALSVREGRVIGGKESSGEARAIVTLYDPKALQVRVEVPVAKFALVRAGSPVEVEVEDVVPGKMLAGVVLYDTHLANVSRNSVPVKVSLPDNPPAELRPDMIASVRFRSPTSGESKTETAKRLVVPRRLLVADADTNRVWVVDPVSGRAALRAVEVARGDGESAEITEGLNATDELISTGREGRTTST
jgi:HlyD family secretion protein